MRIRLNEVLYRAIFRLLVQLMQNHQVVDFLGIWAGSMGWAVAIAVGTWAWCRARPRENSAQTLHPPQGKRQQRKALLRGLASREHSRVMRKTREDLDQATSEQQAGGRRERGSRRRDPLREFEESSRQRAGRRLCFSQCDEPNIDENWANQSNLVRGNTSPKPRSSSRVFYKNRLN